MTSVIITNRLRLEPLRAGHAALLFESLRDDALYRFIPQDPPESESALQERYAFLEGARSPDGSERWLNWVIFLREEREPVGTFQATVREHEISEIAYMVFGEFRQQGIAKEAADAAISYLFDSHSILGVSANIDTENVASIRLVESLGFAKTATIRDADVFKGRTSDEYKYVLTRTDWERRRSGG